MEYSFLFPSMQKLWKSIKKCKTYCRKATGLFFPDTVYILVATNHIRPTPTRLPSQISKTLSNRFLFWFSHWTFTDSFSLHMTCNWVLYVVFVVILITCLTVVPMYTKNHLLSVLYTVSYNFYLLLFPPLYVFIVLVWF